MNKRLIRATGVLVALTLTITGCGDSKDSTAKAIAKETKVSYPVTLTSGGRQTILEKKPERIVSLSPTATEDLFAIQAGPQVIAADERSTYPSEAPKTTLSGFTPNAEAVLAYKPDLVIAQMDANGLVNTLDKAGIDVLIQPPADNLDSIYKQLADLGAATDHAQQALDVTSNMRSQINEKIKRTSDKGKGKTYFHEVDNTLYSSTSNTFIGSVYSLFGLQNIADSATSGNNQFPQLSSEFIVKSNPDYIFLADANFGESKETVSKRPGWANLKAVTNNNVQALDGDIASRWGPRTVNLVETIARTVSGN